MFSDNILRPVLSDDADMPDDDDMDEDMEDDDDDSESVMADDTGDDDQL